MPALHSFGKTPRARASHRSTRGFPHVTRLADQSGVTHSTARLVVGSVFGGRVRVLELKPKVFRASLRRACERGGTTLSGKGSFVFISRTSAQPSIVMFKRLFGTEKSGGSGAPSSGTTQAGGGNKQTPLGAVEQLKDVRPASDPDTRFRSFWCRSRRTVFLAILSFSTISFNRFPLRVGTTPQT